MVTGCRAAGAARSGGAVTTRSAPTVTVAIVTWNSAEWIEAAIRSIRGDVEVLVWDNDSRDDTVGTIARLRRPRLRMMASTRNIGFGAAMNRLTEWCDSELIFLLNPDCRLEEGAIGDLVAWLDQHPEDGAAVPILMSSDGTPQSTFQFRRFPSTSSIAADMLLLDEVLPKNRISRHHRYADLPLDRPVAVEQPAAAAMLVRRSVITRLGGFDERFFPAWFEDVDLCRRMREQGVTIRTVPSARVVHAGASSLSTLGYAAFLEISHRNLALYVDKWFPPAQREIVRAVAIAGVILRMLATPFRPQGGRGRIAALRSLTRLLRGWFFRWNASM